ncbi:MAG: T9SS type A sorting domain-containing protein [Ignavibacteriaceae bacterium]|nr:T9SS type A sorting domain-containing protein [Ignavibacteriaceae bacterium]
MRKAILIRFLLFIALLTNSTQGQLNLSSNSTISDNPFVCGSNDQLYVFWNDFSGSNRVIFFKYLQSGLWSELHTIADRGNAHLLSVFSDQFNTIHLLWKYMDTNQEILRYGQVLSGLLTDTSTVSAHPLSQIISADVFTVNTEEPTAVWEVRRNSQTDVYYSERETPSTWKIKALIYNTSNDSFITPQLVLNPDAVMACYWLKRSNFTIEYMTKGTGVWNGPYEISASPFMGFDLNLKVVNDDFLNVHIICNHLQLVCPCNYFLYFKITSTVWDPITRIPPENNPSIMIDHLNADIAIAKGGKVVIAWEEVTYDLNLNPLISGIGSAEKSTSDWTYNGLIAMHRMPKKPAIYVDEQETLHCVWYDLTSGNSDIYYTSNDSIFSSTEEEYLSFDFNLNQNYPNPFNPNTTISWQSPVAGRQSLKIYDILGNEIATLFDEYKPAGEYKVEFNASSVTRDLSAGSKNLASRIYFYQLKAGSFVQTKKMTLLK